MLTHTADSILCKVLNCSASTRFRVDIEEAVVIYRQESELLLLRLRRYLHDL